MQSTTRWCLNEGSMSSSALRSEWKKQSLSGAEKAAPESLFLRSVDVDSGRRELWQVAKPKDRMGLRPVSSSSPNREHAGLVAG
jgi:hypothetical protein